MDFLRRLFAPTAPVRPVMPISVKCLRCGEIIAGEINLNNELSVDYGEEGGGPTSYVCRKSFTGAARCFQRIDVVLTFDAARRLRDKQITGGQFV